jgi:hypothetical protein
VATIVQIPQLPPGQTPARRRRPPLMAIADLRDDAAAAPDSQLADQSAPHS